MAKLIAGMTMSLDGFVTDRAGSPEALYPDLQALQGSDFMNELIAETGAVLMGKRSFDMADDPDWYVGNYEFQRPIFVVTHTPPATMPKQSDQLTFRFVTDGIESAAAQAKVAAGDRAVQAIGGADLIQQLLRAGLVDELSIDVMPVVLGGGQRLFADGTDLALEKLSVTEVDQRTSFRLRVSSSARDWSQSA